MTRATIQVQIPRPCAVAWEAMTPTAQGRHCAACQHTVTDFTQRTDAEVLALLRQAAGGRVCGRFRVEQLDRELVHAPAAAPRWRAWLLAAATLWGLPAAASAQALRGTHSGGPLPANGSKTTVQQPQPAVANRATMLDTTVKGELEGVPITLQLQRRITGRVTEAETGLPVPGAAVVLKGTTIGVSTDADGRFALAVEAPVKAVLEITSIGYEKSEISQPATEQPLQIKMKTDDRALTGEVAITS